MKSGLTAVVMAVFVVACVAIFCATIGQFVWRAFVRPMLYSAGWVLPTSHDLEIEGWKAERDGNRELAVSKYAESLRLNPANDSVRARLLELGTAINETAPEPGVVADRGVDAATACTTCGKSLSFFQRIGSGLCPECQAEANRREADAARAEVEARALQEREAAEERYAAALRGEATVADLNRLAADGYLIAANRLIRCPVCGHDRFHKQRTLMNTRAATFFNMDWADGGADTRICQLCSHVMWFARG